MMFVFVPDALIYTCSSFAVLLQLSLRNSNRYLCFEELAPFVLSPRTRNFVRNKAVPQHSG